MCYAATGQARASKAITVSSERAAAPTLAFEKNTGIVSGVDNIMEYKLDSGRCTTINDTTLDTNDLIVDTKSTIMIRYQSNGGLASCDCSKTIDRTPIPTAPTKPYYEVGQTYHQIGGIDANMEIRRHGGAGTANLYNELNIENQVSEPEETIYEFRYKATETSSASEVLPITIPAVRKVPVLP